MHQPTLRRQGRGRTSAASGARGIAARYSSSSFPSTAFGSVR
ncbi:MAG: hypothetical protein OXG81_12380 [Acidobacteria bacterium]|nr:hypothetical protein [Acidobacteriota bacterium]